MSVLKMIKDLKPGLPLLRRGNEGEALKQKKHIQIKNASLHLNRCLLPIACCLLSIVSFAQNNNSKQKIAVFAPLYLDSAFDATNTYRYDKSFPKFINPGLEFYEGVQLALDSLEQRKSAARGFCI